MEIEKLIIDEKENVNNKLQLPARICSIYLLTNIVNNKIYIGQTWNKPEDRMCKNGEGYSHSPYLYNAVKKYGTDKFKYTTLETCETQEKANELEEFYIKLYNSQNHEIGYNLKDGGSVGQHSEETKSKISATLKEKFDKMTPEERAKRASPVSGYWEGKERGPQSEEHREKVIQTLQPGGFTGYEHSDETKEKMSQATRQMWENGIFSKESIKKGHEKLKMPKEKEQAIIKAYQDNMSISDIEKTFDTGRTSIYRILKRNNISKNREN